MIVAAPMNELGIRAVPDPGCNDLRGAKIENGTRDRTQFAGRYQAGVDRRVRIGLNAQMRQQSVAGAGQIPVTVMGKVYDGRRGGHRRVVDPQLVLVRQPVDNPHAKFTGVTLVAVRTHERQQECRAVGGIRALNRPDPAAEALLAAVLGIGRIVERQLVVSCHPMRIDRSLFDWRSDPPLHRNIHVRAGTAPRCRNQGRRHRTVRVNPPPGRCAMWHRDSVSRPPFRA